MGRWVGAWDGGWVCACAYLAGIVVTVDDDASDVVGGPVLRLCQRLSRRVCARARALVCVCVCVCACVCGCVCGRVRVHVGVFCARAFGARGCSSACVTAAFVRAAPVSLFMSATAMGSMVLCSLWRRSFVAAALFGLPCFPLHKRV